MFPNLRRALGADGIRASYLGKEREVTYMTDTEALDIASAFLEDRLGRRSSKEVWRVTA